MEERLRSILEDERVQRLVLRIVVVYIVAFRFRGRSRFAKPARKIDVRNKDDVKE